MVLTDNDSQEFDRLSLYGPGFGYNIFDKFQVFSQDLTHSKIKYDLANSFLPYQSNVRQKDLIGGQMKRSILAQFPIYPYFESSG